MALNELSLQKMRENERPPRSLGPFEPSETEQGGKNGATETEKSAMKLEEI